MPAVWDNNIDLSSIGTSLTPAVPAGLTTMAIFGKSLRASLYNWANPASPLLTNSGGVSLPLITPGVSGMTVQGGTGSSLVSNQVTTPDLPSVGSETLFLVFAIQPTNWASFVAEAFGVWNGTAGTLAQACYSVAQSATSGVSLSCGYINGAGAVSSFNKGVFVTPGALSTTIAEQAIVSTPQVYKFKFDIPNLLVTWQNMTQAGIVGAPATTTATLAITAGSTRPVITGPYGMLGGIQAPLNINVVHHAHLRYSRATTLSEDALVYSQLKTIMSVRGFVV